MNNTNDLSIDELITHYEQKMDEESRNTSLYEQYYHTRKYLLELKDVKEEQEYHVGDIVWCVDCEEYIEDEEGNYTYDYSGNIFMGTCGDYVLVTSEYSHCKDNFNRQLCEMCDESSLGQIPDIMIYRKRYVFKNKEDARIACGIK